MMKRAVVVAHPDDECLWAAGYILNHPGDWTGICLTIPRSDPERLSKFPAACVALGIEHNIMLSLPETDILGLSPELARFLDLNSYAMVLTHNSVGEYGHFHHKQTHRWVSENYAGELIYFGYKAGDIKIDLTPYQYEAKLAALKKYDHVSKSDQGLPKWEALLNVHPFGKTDYYIRRTRDGLPEIPFL